MNEKSIVFAKKTAVKFDKIFACAGEIFVLILGTKNPITEKAECIGIFGGLLQ